MTNLFSVSALFIMYREALEACVVISVMLSIMGRLGLHKLKRQGASYLPLPMPRPRSSTGRCTLASRVHPWSRWSMSWPQRPCCAVHWHTVHVSAMHVPSMRFLRRRHCQPAEVVACCAMSRCNWQRRSAHLSSRRCRGIVLASELREVAWCVCSVSQPRLSAVWWGAFSGVATAVLLGVIFMIIFYVLGNTVFQARVRAW